MSTASAGGLGSQLQVSNELPEPIANGAPANLFVKRKTSISLKQDEDDRTQTRRYSATQARRLSAWSSEPVVTLQVPVANGFANEPLQGRLQEQYDNFEDGVVLSRIIAAQMGQPELSSSDRNIMRSKTFKVWQALQYFCHSTTFHGVPHIAASRSLVRIAYWSILLIVALCLMIYAIVEISRAYFAFNTYISEVQSLVGRLKFPAVTICNLNQYSKSAVQETLNYTEEQLFNTVLFADLFSTRQELTRYRSADFSQLAAELEEDTAAFVSAGLTAFSHKLENMLWSCYYNDRPCSVDSFTTFDNINGRCFTFNGDTSNLLYTRTPGSMFGLELVLNAEQYEYYLAKSDSVGFKVYIHRQGDIPYLGEHAGFTVSPGVHTDVVLTAEAFSYLEPPQGSCRKNLKLDYYEIYTRQACLDECMTKFIVRSCGCRQQYMPGDVLVCGPNKTAFCFPNASKNFSYTQCDCPIPCEIPESYKHELSYSVYPSQHYPALLERTGALNNQTSLPDFVLTYDSEHNVTRFNENGTLEFFRENFLKITIYYNELTLSKYTETLEYQASQYIADFGGHLGLFTGAGFLTLFEFMEVCLGVLYPADTDNRR